MNILKTKNLSYAHIKKPMLFYDININLNSGIVFLFSENGAGKTTLLEILCGMRKGYFGDVKVAENIPSQSVNNITFLPGKVIAFKNKSVLKNLNFACDVIGKDIKSIIINDSWINNYKNVKFKKLSIYNKAMFALKRAELKNAKLLLIDVNLNGFLPEDIKNYANYLQNLFKNAKNRLIIISIEAEDYKKLQFNNNDACFYYLFGKLYKFNSFKDYKDNLNFKGMADYLDYKNVLAKVNYTNNGYIITINNKTIKLSDKYMFAVENYFSVTNQVDVYIYYNGDILSLSDDKFNLSIENGDILLFDKLSGERLK